jgi:hypothetical protein
MIAYRGVETYSAWSRLFMYIVQFDLFKITITGYVLSIDERQCTVMYGTAKYLCLGYRVSRKLVQTFSFSRKLPHSPCYTKRNSNLCKKSHVIKLLRAFCSCPTYTYFHENLWENIFLTAFAKIFYTNFASNFCLFIFAKTNISF